jgi:hypothetical protein
MKKCLIILILSYLNNLNAQTDTIYHFFNKPSINNYIRYTTSSIGGLCDGVREASHFYNVPDFLNPDLTWRNKYKNGDPCQGEAFPQSTNLLVAFTDWYHGLGGIRTLSNITYTISITYKFYNKKYYKIKYYLLDIGKEIVLNFIIYNGSKTLVMNYYKYK